MAKKSLISVWQWWDVKLLQYDFTSSEQLLMFHLIRLFNKTFWTPAQISVNRLAAEMHCDKRTVKKSLDGLIDKGLICNTKNGYLLNTEDTPNDESDSDINGRVESYNAAEIVPNRLREIINQEGV